MALQNALINIAADNSPNLSGQKRKDVALDSVDLNESSIGNVDVDESECELSLSSPELTTLTILLSIVMSGAPLKGTQFAVISASPDHGTNILLTKEPPAPLSNVNLGVRWGVWCSIARKRRCVQFLSM